MTALEVMLEMPGMIESDRACDFGYSLRFIDIAVTHAASLVILDIMTGSALVHCRHIAIGRFLTAADFDMAHLALDLLLADME